jgi:hypothetical protein
MHGTTINNTVLPYQMVDFSDGVVGGLHRPVTQGLESRFTVFVMHVETDYLQFSACTVLPKRGFTLFCANNAASKTGIITDLAFKALMGDAIAWFHNQIFVEPVVILGHSGGGTMLSGYQIVAENGPSACNGTEKIYPCSDSVGDLAPADAFIFVDTNYGLSTMTLLSINPAVEDETTGAKIN